MTSPALLTDHYELTMLQAALADGTANRRCTFEVFGRRLPNGRRYGVVCGTGRLLNAIERFRFDDQQLSFLRETSVVNAATLDWLHNFRFQGNIDGYKEGEAYFPHSPLLTVSGTFGEAVLLETLALSILNFDTAVASAAMRMKVAAGNRACNEMGSRRTHEQSAVAAARAAYIAGFSATSNLQAGAQFAIPTMGTSAHAFTLLHDNEREAFAAQVESLGTSTTLLIDTFDIETGVKNAIEVAGRNLGAVRIDSGDLVTQARNVRKQLDSLGATNTKIVVTSDLDEHAIAALANAPVDAYGVGTSLVTGSGHPTASLVYKLVERVDSTGTMQPVAKKSENKASRGGRKFAKRELRNGAAIAEVVTTESSQQDQHNKNVQQDQKDQQTRALIAPLMRDGIRVNNDTVEDARAHARLAINELPADTFRLSPGEPAIPTHFL